MTGSSSMTTANCALTSPSLAGGAPDTRRAPRAREIAEFALSTQLRDIPEQVLTRSRHLILDAVGVAFASTAYPFARTALEALQRSGEGPAPVIGMAERLSFRDAAVLNGVLIHGLDYDDTHMPAVAHLTAAALPAAMAAAASARASEAALLEAYVVAMEVGARVGMAGAGGLHDAGFHPTGIAGAFSAAIAAGKVHGLDAHRLTMAQGIAGSMSAGLMEFLEDGAWTKRLHPGWAAMSGLTAANFAAAGWTGPQTVYEGRFGLLRSHLAGAPSPDVQTADLGTTWEVMRVAVKPYPICHFIHAFADAATVLREKHSIRPSDIKSIRCAIHPTPGKVVCEPAESKWAPRHEYDAKFSLPYVVSTVLSRGGFTLADLNDDALADAEVRSLARRVHVVEDPDSAFPHAYSGYVELELTDGRTVSHREQINRGHDERPLSDAAIVSKFRETMSLVADDSTIQRVETAALGLGGDGPAAEFAERCRA